MNEWYNPKREADGKGACDYYWLESVLNPIFWIVLLGILAWGVILYIKKKKFKKDKNRKK